MVADSLKSLPRPILVALDDVDRLAHDEIRLLFQLIKANADFPNIIYLVLAQRSTVIKALEPIAPGQGDAFLEKIVQVGFDVPRIDRKQLEKLLFSGLDRLLADERVGTGSLLSEWITFLADQRPEAWLFQAENVRGPLMRDNVQRRFIQPKLATIGLG
jgi:hypothetical protein